MIPDIITAKNVKQLTTAELYRVLLDAEYAANHMEYFSKVGYRQVLRFVELLQKERRKRLFRFTQLLKKEKKKRRLT